MGIIHLLAHTGHLDLYVISILLLGLADMPGNRHCYLHILQRDRSKSPRTLGCILAYLQQPLQLFEGQDTECPTVDQSSPRPSGGSTPPNMGERSLAKRYDQCMPLYLSIACLIADDQLLSSTAPGTLITKRNTTTAVKSIPVPDQMRVPPSHTNVSS